MEECEDIRHTLGMNDLYKLRKETIERIFGTAKENHGFRYTQIFGKARMEMKVGLTFACMNLKKLAKMKQRMEILESYISQIFRMFQEKIYTEKSGVGVLTPTPLCLQSGMENKISIFFCS